MPLVGSRYSDARARPSITTVEHGLFYAVESTAAWTSPAAAAYLHKSGNARDHVAGSIHNRAVGHHCLDLPPVQGAKCVLQAGDAFRDDSDRRVLFLLGTPCTKHPLETGLKAAEAWVHTLGHEAYL